MPLRRIFRVAFYLIGMVVLAIGITLNTKTNLGVSPLISIGFVVSEITGVRFGDMTFLVYALFIAIQYALRRKNSRAKDLLQFLVALIFSRLLNLFVVILPTPQTLVGRYLVLILAVCLVGAGAGTTLNMDLIPNPGDGLVGAVSDTFQLETGLAKNICDASFVAISLIVSLVWTHRIIGIGIGTIITVLLCGRAMAFSNKLLRKPTRRLAGLDN